VGSEMCIRDRMYTLGYITQAN